MKHLLLSRRLGSRAKFRAGRIHPLWALVGAATIAACTQERPHPIQPAPAPIEAPTPRETASPTPSAAPSASGPHRASLGRQGELYLPPWFTPTRGGYDLVVHFHGVSKHQEANLERAHLNAAVVSVNLGMGTDPYANAFRTPDAFERTLTAVTTEIERSGRAPGAHVRRIALTAWSAGFVSIAKILADPAAMERVDAVLLADGFFTSFSDPKRRVVNTASLEKFTRLVELSGKDEKLFAITHTTIPTGPYPSVQECVAKLLELSAIPKVPASGTGPRKMQELYTVDRGSFHVHGYEGQLAGDHVKQLQAMGETLLPYLKARWEKDATEVTTARVDSAPR